MIKLRMNVSITVAILAHVAVASAQVATDPMPRATLDEKLEVTGPEVRATQLESRMSLSVHVNGYGPFRFVVDSGADRSVIGKRVADRLGLSMGESINVISVSEAKSVPTVHVSSLVVGTSRIADLQMPVLAERDLGADGLLGIDALAEQRLMLDFQHKTVIVEDGRHRLPSSPGDIVVTARRQKGQLIITQVTAGGHSALAVIDSGSMISMGNLALMRKIFGGHNAPKVFPTAVTGVTGATLTVPTAIVSELQIGPIRLENIPMAFADLPPFSKFGLKQEPAVLLGTDILQAFARVSLDFGKRKVRFQLRPQKGATIGAY